MAMIKDEEGENGSTAAIIGIAFAVTFGVLVSLLLGAWLFVWNRRRHREGRGISRHTYRMPRSPEPAVTRRKANRS